MSRRRQSFRERWSDGPGTWGANPQSIVEAEQELRTTHPRRRLGQEAIDRLTAEAHARRNHRG